MRNKKYRTPLESYVICKACSSRIRANTTGVWTMCACSQTRVKGDEHLHTVKGGPYVVFQSRAEFYQVTDEEKYGWY